MPAALRVLIVAEDASASFGGEAALPLHYFGRLLERGVDVRLLVHERNRGPLMDQFPDHVDRMHFVSDRRLHRLIWSATARLPTVVGQSLTIPLLTALTQVDLRREVKVLVRRFGINVIHQPTPVSPKALSMMFAVGAPVIFGPLNGGMSYPPGFRHLEGRAGRLMISLARWVSEFLHLFLPAKRRAYAVLVANPRTRDALPRRVGARIVELVENGVDTTLFAPARHVPTSEPGAVRFVFVGRLIALKAVDLLLEAFASIHADIPHGTLDVIGDGLERAHLEEVAQALGINSDVTFHGWLTQDDIVAILRKADVFVLPSLRECGGAVVLEAMAVGVPVIATRWGGPADYLDDGAGLLVDPTNPDQFRADIAAAMLKLAREPDTRTLLASNALGRVRRDFDWDRKIDRVTEVYLNALEAPEAGDFHRH